MADSTCRAFIWIWFVQSYLPAKGKQLRPCFTYTSSANARDTDTTEHALAQLPLDTDSKIFGRFQQVSLHDCTVARRDGNLHNSQRAIGADWLLLPHTGIREEIEDSRIRADSVKRDWHKEI